VKSTFVKPILNFPSQNGAQILRHTSSADKRHIIRRVLDKHVSSVGNRGRLDSTESPKGGLPAEVPKILAKPLGNKRNADDYSYALAA
jgi:hypothetical protein